MPTRGIASSRNTSGHFSARAIAAAQPTTPPPMMTTFAVSMDEFTAAAHARRCNRRLPASVVGNGALQQRSAGYEPGLGAVVHRIVEFFAITIARPERRAAMLAVPVQRVEKEVEFLQPRLVKAVITHN